MGRLWAGASALADKESLTMIEAEWWEYDDADEMAEAVAGDIGFIIESALDARGSSLIALPGGGTAEPIYKALAAKKLPWKQVTIIPTDERYRSTPISLESGIGGASVAIQ